ncbi:hypothetical protein [Streptomyces sp. W1SF4]|uniref:hypothetical protein n=1 Tax=Streptomyces sp. W1SF4 TaxID=2305220 RepID=UPI000F6B3343|nr:hypothetical protein [Streptomyces sp. W1SF4]AZM92152.1 hypothetical protein D1J60_29815 [Streptomyces sp. W1SF4]
MSTQTPSVPYPNLLRWLAGEAPDTPKIAAELRTMAGLPHYERFLLDLEDERGAFQAALLAAFPQPALDKSDFSQAQGSLTAVTSPTLKTAGPVCLTSLGEPRDAFRPAYLWTAPDGVLRYKGGTVYVTTLNTRMKLSADNTGRLYVASAKHPLKLWIRKGNQDATVQQVFTVVAGAGAGGYDALGAQGVVVWDSSPGGPLDTPKGLVTVITKSGAFRSITWTTPYCTAGWVDSLLPTLITRGTIPGPGGEKKIAQNVHSAQIVGSAWLPDVDNLDCKPAEMPPQWQADVAATLCPLAANHVQLGHITEFCGILKKAGFAAGGTDLAARITYLLVNHPQRRADLESLPHIKAYYKQCF